MPLYRNKQAKESVRTVAGSRNDRDLAAKAENAKSGWELVNEDEAEQAPAETAVEPVKPAPAKPAK